MKKYLYIALAALGMMGCEEELDRVSSGSGFLISLGDAPVSMETKSTPEELGEPLKTNFSIEVLKHSTGESETYKYKENLVVPASVGLYDITASYGDNPELALDAPYYEGKAEDEEIKEGATEPVSVAIECTVANALASVVYEDEAKFQELFSSYGVNVKVGNLNVTLNNSNAGKSAYYQAGSKPTFTFVGTLKGNGKEVTKSLTAEDDPALGEDATFAAAKHCILTLSLGTTEPGVNLTLSKVKVEEVTINETIPLEWLPAPKVGGFNDDAATSLTYTETADAIPAILKFTGSHTIQDVEFSFEFQDTQDKFQALNGKTFSLQNLTLDDALLFNAAQITLPVLDESTTEGNFDFTTMTASLQTNAGAETSNKIKLRVKANDRWSSEEPVAYEIKTIAPKVTVTAKPEDIWSKELTVSGATVETGDSETILANIKYQYNENGEWKDCTGTGGLLAKLESHPSDAKMQVRAVYRDVVACKPTTFDLEKTEQLPNSDMENWNRTDSGWDFPNYIPRASSNDVEYWDTNNEFTFRYNVAIKNAYNGFPAVSYSTTNKHGGNRSAELRNTAAGPVNGALGRTVHDNNRIAGMLFYGNYTGTTSTSLADGNVNIDEGRPFDSRPTQLKFYSTYEPYGTDTYEVIVKVFDSENNVIGNGSFTSSNSKTNWSEESIDINYQGTGTINKAVKIYVFFQSSNAGQGNVPYEKKRKVTLADYGSATTHSGSVLRIDDISLVYGK